MSKFKVGDEVAIAAVVKITAIQPNNNGTVSYSTDRGISIHEKLLEQIEIPAKPTDRLMGREEPKAAPKFKVGDRVIVAGKHDGEISAISTLGNDDEPYLVYCPTIGTHSGSYGLGAICKQGHEGKCTWRSERDLSPAPEPKYYTGKVFAVRTKERTIDKNELERVGRVYEIVDGVPIGETFWAKGYRFKTFLEFCWHYSATEWAEVKE